MSNSSIKRMYSVDESNLTIYTSFLCTAIMRDLSFFEEYGITEEKILAMKELNEIFELIPLDSYLLGQVASATELKIKCAETVKNTMRSMAMRVAMKYGMKSSTYKRLGIIGMGSFSEDKLLVNARAAHELLTELLPELASYGLTQVMLDNFAIEINAYESAKNEKAAKIEARAKNTQNKISTGNELYGMVATYCNLGKKIFTNNNPAKYHDYLIFRNAGKRKRRPEKEEMTLQPSEG